MSTVILSEFTRSMTSGLYTNWQNTLKNSLMGVVTATELDHLHELSEYRAGVLAEAQAQSISFVDYFCGILGMNPATHPYTFEIVLSALKVGEFISMHYKDVFNRPRPSHLSPSLYPPLDPPGHPAFPSGHATQAYLVAKCLSDGIMPPVAGQPLLRLAERIARNREVLGLHYPSDSKAGMQLAGLAFAKLITGSKYSTIKASAAQEWQ